MIRLQLPPPANWQDFESLCLALWSEIWGDPTAQKNGRQGQPQSGVDVSGQIRGTGDWCGVQCKLKSQLTGGELSSKELEAEVTKARSFRPKLVAYTFATTCPSDVIIQEHARIMSAREEFQVRIFSWSDIEDALSFRSSILAAFYAPLVQATQVMVGTGGVIQKTFNGSANPVLEAVTFFEESNARILLAEEIRSEVKNVAAELLLNAFEHGGATSSTLRLSSKMLELVDDGQAFDPLTAAPRTSPGAGLLYFAHFRTK